MDKRYQVFISSTYVDLSAERQEVIKALLELDCIPCGMEYFPAASEDTWSYITDLIDQCDYYVVIVGGRYGSLNQDGTSYTEQEYLYAREKEIPCIAFLHANPNDIAAKHSESTNEGRKRLDLFLIELKKSLCKEWSSAHELGSVVSRSLTQLIKRHPRTGWIPASQAGDPRLTEESLNLSKKVIELESQLSALRGRAKVDTSDLADGNELIEVSFTCSIAESVNQGKTQSWAVVKRDRAQLAVSWNDLFRVIAPKITPTASE